MKKLFFWLVSCLFILHSQAQVSIDRYAGSTDADYDKDFSLGGKGFLVVAVILFVLWLREQERRRKSVHNGTFKPII